MTVVQARHHGCTVCGLACIGPLKHIVRSAAVAADRPPEAGNARLLIIEVERAETMGEDRGRDEDES